MHAKLNGNAFHSSWWKVQIGTQQQSHKPGQQGIGAAERGLDRPTPMQQSEKAQNRQHGNVQHSRIIMDHLPELFG